MERETKVSPLTIASRELAAWRSATDETKRAEHVRAARTAIEDARRVLYMLDSKCQTAESVTR